MQKFLVGLAMSIAMTTGAAAQNLPLNVEEWRSATEVLASAREKVSKGWYQVEPVLGAECIATALEKSWSELNKSLVDWDYVKMAMNAAIESPSLESLSLDDDPLSTPYWGRYFIYWNDAEGRTQDEVLAAFDRAISFAHSEEAAALDSKATGDQVIEYDIRLMEQLGLPMAEKFR